jgi:hypothetical protein
VPWFHGDMCFQCCSAFPHLSLHVLNWLTSYFTDTWIDRGVRLSGRHAPLIQFCSIISYEMAFIWPKFEIVTARVSSWSCDRHQVAGTLSDVAVKRIRELREVILSTACDILHNILCESPMHVQIFVLNVILNTNLKTKNLSIFASFTVIEIN